MGSGENEKEASKMRVKRKTSHCTPSVISADKRTNYISASRRPGVRAGTGSLPALFVRGHVVIGSTGSHKSQRGLPSGISAFHLGFFCIPVPSCLLSLPSIGQNGLLLFQTALSLLMPQVSGLCTLQGPVSGKSCSQSPKIKAQRRAVCKPDGSDGPSSALPIRREV